MDAPAYVMLSQPPPRATLPPPAPVQRSTNTTRTTNGGGGGGGGGGRIETYKGILLCERQTHVGNRPAAAPQPFLPAGANAEVGISSLGLGPSVERQKQHEGARTNLAKKAPGLPAQREYKAALKALAKAKQQERMDQFESQLAQEVWKDEFTKKQQEKRQATLGTTKSDVDDRRAGSAPGNVDLMADDSLVAALPPTTPPGISSHNPAFAVPNPPVPESEEDEEEEEETPLKRQPTPPRTKPPLARAPGKQKKKPRWAMGENEVAAAEMDEGDDLIDFANNLDADGFLEDFEVREALNIIKERVSELKGDNEEKESNLTDHEMLAVEEEIEKAQQAREAWRVRWENGQRDGSEPPPSGGSGSKLALPTVVQPTAHVSNNSMTEPGQTVTVATHSTSAQAGEPGEGEQKRILLQLKKAKDNVQNLPYMYRCPSI